MIICIICIIGILSLFFEMRHELRTFQTTNYRIYSQKLKGLNKNKKIIFLSDLHNQEYDRDNQTLLKKIRDEKPDLILVGGDMLVGQVGYSVEPAFSFVSQLPDIAPTYHGYGNHEQRLKEKPKVFKIDYEGYQKGLEQCGVVFLNNETVDIMLGDTPVYITGLTIPLENYQHFKTPKLSSQEIRKRIGKKEDGYHILLAHNPAYMKEYLNWGADLILSGHFHGGLIRIPGFRGLIIPGIGSYKKYSGGIYKEKDKRIIVSKGLGNHTFKIRLFNKAEIISISLLHKN